MVPSPKRLAVSAEEQNAGFLRHWRDWDGDISDTGVAVEGIGAGG